MGARRNKEFGNLSNIDVMPSAHGAAQKKLIGKANY
jgi:hypothetical protein